MVIHTALPRYSLVLYSVPCYSYYIQYSPVNDILYQNACEN